MTAVVLVFAASFGLVIGSFLNVVLYRLPRQQSLSNPPSRCPSCGTRIAWRDNIPVVSWLLLRGRCRVCHAAISPRYPMIEAGTAVVFVAVAALVLSA